MSITNTRDVAPVREVFPGTRRYTQHTIFELAETIRERDIVTYEHCRRVAIYANRLARHMGWHRRARTGAGGADPRPRQDVDAE